MSSAFHDVAIDSQERNLEEDMVERAIEKRKRIFKKLAIVQVSSGVLALSLSSAAAAVRNSDPTFISYNFTTSSPGIWCGIFFIISSLMIWFVSYKRDAGTVIITWCVSSLGVVLSCVMLCIDLTTCIVFLGDTSCCLNSKTTLVIIQLSLSVISCLQVIVSTITTGVCCRVYCCLEKKFHYKAAVYTVFKKEKSYGGQNKLPTGGRTDIGRITSTSSFELPK